MNYYRISHSNSRYFFASWSGIGWWDYEFDCDWIIETGVWMWLHVGSSEFAYLKLRNHLQPTFLFDWRVATNDAKFLAREKSNIDKIEKLRRKAADTEGSLRCIQLARATWTVRQSTISKSSSQLEGYCKGGFITNLWDYESYRGTEADKCWPVFFSFLSWRFPSNRASRHKASWHNN